MSQRLSMRVKFLEDYIKFLSFFKNQIRYNSGSIIDIMDSYNAKGIISSFLNECIMKVKSGDSFAKAWEDSIELIPKDYGLKFEDINLIKDFGLLLGSTDIEGEIMHCKLNLKLMQENLDDAREEKKKKERLYIMLGFFIGMLLAVLFS